MDLGENFPDGTPAHFRGEDDLPGEPAPCPNCHTMLHPTDIVPVEDGTAIPHPMSRCISIVMAQRNEAVQRGIDLLDRWLNGEPLGPNRGIRAALEALRGPSRSALAPKKPE